MPTSDCYVRTRKSEGVLAAGYGRKDGDDVAFLYLGVERAQVAHVLVIDVDVDEAMEPAVLRPDVLRDPGVFGFQVVEKSRKVGTIGLDGRIPAGVLAHDRR